MRIAGCGMNAEDMKRRTKQFALETIKLVAISAASITTARKRKQ
jgi:hypothetical protein